MIMYNIFHLDRAALCQIATFITGVTVDFDNITKLLRYLDTSFGDRDPTSTARRELDEFKQRKDFSAYLTEFRRIMGRLGYDENAQMDALEIGLSSKLKDVLVYTTQPETMAGYE
jgi:hypothetical protein